MNLVGKIVLGVIAVVIIGAIALFVWAYNKVKIQDLELLETDTLAEKVEKANTWLSELQQNNKFNGAVLLIKNDSVLIKNTYGFADSKKTIPLTNNSMFRLASVSKQFTATGILLLKEQAKLDIDAPITQYLPDLPYTTVTVRHLLNHTSGIPDVYMSFPTKYKTEVGELLTNAKVVQLLVKEDLPLDNPPNTVHQYSNIGYVLLSAIIEQVSGTSFENFMKTELFDKLNMNETRVWNLTSTDTTFPNKTESFDNVMGDIMDLKPGVLDGVSGDGSVFSSINDFEIWNRFWYGNTLLSQASIEDAFSPVTLADGSTSNYGFGWIITPNVKVMWHNGSWLGARTIIIRNEELKNCMVILDNSSTLSLDEIAQQLVKVVK